MVMVALIFLLIKVSGNLRLKLQRHINTTVDVKALNQLITGAKLANVTNKILVTNSYFTSEVKARALRLGVELIDRDELQNLWVKKTLRNWS